MNRTATYTQEFTVDAATVSARGFIQLSLVLETEKLLLPLLTHTVAASMITNYHTTITTNMEYTKQNKTKKFSIWFHHPTQAGSGGWGGFGFGSDGETWILEKPNIG